MWPAKSVPGVDLEEEISKVQEAAAEFEGEKEKSYGWVLDYAFWRYERLNHVEERAEEKALHILQLEIAFLTGAWAIGHWLTTNGYQFDSIARILLTVGFASMAASLLFALGVVHPINRLAPNTEELAAKVVFWEETEDMAKAKFALILSAAVQTTLLAANLRATRVQRAIVYGTIAAVLIILGLASGRKHQPPTWGQRPYSLVDCRRESGAVARPRLASDYRYQSVGRLDRRNSSLSRSCS